MMEVIWPGLLDLVMDLGRPGFRAQGVPEGGAADAVALILANRLVGNPGHAAGLVMLMRGPTLRFPHGGRVALAGADMQARLNGAPAPLGRPWRFRPAANLSWNRRQAACGGIWRWPGESRPLLCWAAARLFCPAVSAAGRGGH